MNRLPKYRGLLIGLLLAGLGAGCTQTEPTRTTLGNLPDEPLNDTPKVTAMTFFAHGHLLERSGNYERAVIQYRKALRLKPDFVGAHNRLGITLNKLGRHEQASEQFRQAIALRSDEAYLYNNLGFSLYLEKKYDQADEVLKHALELDPDFARARMNHAIVLAELGHYDAAYQELLKVGNRADACYNMGLMLTEGKRYKEAAQYLEAALAVRPDFDAARRQLHEVGRLAAEAEALQAARFAKVHPATPAPTVAAGAADGPPAANATASQTTATASKSAKTATKTARVTHNPSHNTKGTSRSRVASSTHARHPKATTKQPGAHATRRSASTSHVTDTELTAIERLFERGCEPALVEPGASFDTDTLAALVLQALDAIEHRTADADERWCELSDYVATAMARTTHSTLAK